MPRCLARMEWPSQFHATAPPKDSADDGLSQVGVVQHGSPVRKGSVGGQ